MIAGTTHDTRTRRDQLKKEVLATIVGRMAEAEACGLDAYVAARQAFPTVPEIVIAEAWTSWSLAGEEAWWTSLERTIDGEILARAIADAGAGRA